MIDTRLRNSKVLYITSFSYNRSVAEYISRFGHGGFGAFLEVINNKSRIDIDDYASYRCSHVLIPKGTKYRVLKLDRVDKIAHVLLEEI